MKLKIEDLIVSRDRLRKDASIYDKMRGSGNKDDSEKFVIVANLLDELIGGYKNGEIRISIGRESD